MKRLYTLLLSGLVLAASASVAVPTAMRHLGKSQSGFLVEQTVTKNAKTHSLTKLTGTCTAIKKGITRVNANPSYKFKDLSYKNIATIQAEKATKSTNRAFNKAPRKAEDFSTYTWTEKGDGKFLASVVAEIYNASTELADVKVFEANDHSGVYKLVGVWPDLLTGAELIIDATDPDFVTIPVQYTGIDDNVDGETYIASLSQVYMNDYEWTKEEVIENAPECVISIKDNVIMMPSGTVALNWPNAPEDSKYGTKPTDWSANTTDGEIVLPGGTYVSPWTLVTDKAQFTENILYPVFAKGTENTATSTHELYYKTSNPNIYKLVDPFKTLYSGLGFESESPALVFDATDPTNVLIEMTASGINGGATDGVYYYFSQSWYDGEDPTDDELKITLAKQDDGSYKLTVPVKATLIYAATAKEIYYGSTFASELSFEMPKTEDPIEPEYSVYSNSLIGEGLVLNSWWNATLDTNTPNPDGEGNVFSMTNAGTLEGNFSGGFQTPTDFTSTLTGPLHSATLGFDWYATTPCTITVRLAAGKEENKTVTVTADDVNKWNHTELDVTEDFPDVATAWKDWTTEGKNNCVFGVVVEQFNADTKVYFNNVAYTNCDTEWKQPAVEPPFWPAAPVPTQAADNVMSLLSAKYRPVMGFNFNQWGSATVYDQNYNQEDGSLVARMSNFSYLGWEFMDHIDVSTMEYLHVDFYPMASTAFAVTPISPSHEKLYTVAAENVKTGEWNSIDVPLTYFEGVDFADLFQFKFAEGNGSTVYVTNVYFYKEGETPEIDVTGDYVGTIGDYYFENSVGEYEDDVTAVQDGTTVTFSSPSFNTDVTATIDPATGVITFNPSENLGAIELDGTTYYVQFQPMQWITDDPETLNGHVAYEPYSVTYDPETHEITFPADHGFVWNAYRDQALTSLAGTLNGFDVIKLTWVDPSIDPNEGWTSLGEATFKDGWLLPGVKIDQTDPANWYKVELQQNDADENVYRLVDPYKGNCPIAQYNESTKPGYIQFDVTDPDHVVFATDVNAGFANSQMGIRTLYCSNTYGAMVELANANGIPVDELLANMGEGYQFSTFKDGIVTIPSWIGENGYENEAAFGLTAGEIDYGWIDTEKKPLNMEAKIFFPGVDSIRELNAKSEASSEVYYNLHGQRIAKPTVPGLYIRNNQKVVVR